MDFSKAHKKLERAERKKDLFYLFEVYILEGLEFEPQTYNTQISGVFADYQYWWDELSR